MNVAALDYRHLVSLFAPMLDEAVSPSAQTVRGTVLEALERGPAITGGVRHIALYRLFAAIEGAHDVAVAADTVKNAAALIEALPSGTLVPEIVIEEDGEIGLDWQETRRRALNVNVGPSGMIGYSALVGSEPIYGKAPFGGQLPEMVALLLRRVLAAES